MNLFCKIILLLGLLSCNHIVVSQDKSEGETTQDDNTAEPWIIELDDNLNDSSLGDSEQDKNNDNNVELIIGGSSKEGIAKKSELPVVD